MVPDNRVRILLCVEGPSDVSALKCLSKALHSNDPKLPDLSSDSRVTFIVLGGGTLSHWVNEHYLKGLGRPEVHIYDRDVTKYATAISEVNSRGDGSWGIQTLKYEIENYLHPDAIQEGLNLNVAITDNDDIPNIIHGLTGWRTDTAKRKLAKNAFPRMTAARISERDPKGEVEGWFRRIGAML